MSLRTQWLPYYKNLLEKLGKNWRKRAWFQKNSYNKNIGIKEGEEMGFEEDVVVGAGVACVQKGQCAGCKEAKSVAIAEGVTCIDACAFEYCFNLKSITLPASLEGLGDDVFAGCKSLREIVFLGTKEQWRALKRIDENPGKALWKKWNFHCYNCVVKCNDGSINFYDCDTLDTEGDLLIPSKVIEVPERASCAIGVPERAWMSCWAVKKVVIEEGVESIGKMAFSHCDNLESIEIPKSVTYIGWGAFNHCWSLTNIVIPDGVTVIEDSAFAQCINLKSVTIPAGIMYINPSAFFMCDCLEEVVFKGTLEQWESVYARGAKDGSLAPSPYIPMFCLRCLGEE